MTVREGETWRAGRYVRTVLAVTKLRVCYRDDDGQHWMTLAGFTTWARTARKVR